MRPQRSPRRAHWIIAINLLAIVQLSLLLQPTYSAFSAVTGNANTFASAVSFGPTCSQPAKAFTAINGFETGIDLATGSWSELGTGGGTVTSDTTTVHGGTRSMKVAQVNGGDAYLMQMAPASQTVMVTRWAMRFSVRPQDGDELFNVKNGGSVDMKMQFDGTNKLNVEMSSTVVSTTTIALNTWYVIDLRYSVAANPHRVDWRINGVAQTAATSATAATTLADMRWGSSSDTNLYTAFYDDLVISHTSADYPIGDGVVKAVRPNGQGTHATSGSFQNHDNSAIGASSPGYLDEDPITSNTDYVKQVTAGTGSYLEFTFPDVNECVDGVVATVGYHASGTSANAARTDIKVGGVTTSVVTNMNATSLTRVVKKIAPSGSAWVYTDLNDAVVRFGYASTISSRIPYLDAVTLEYNVPV